MRSARWCGCPGGAGALIIAIVLAWLPPTRAAAADGPRYRNHQDLTKALQAAAAAHPNLARVRSMGKTREGRDLWVVEIANRAGAPVEERPALLVAANFEGDHLVGSELAAYLVEFLLDRYASDAAVRQRLDEHVVYVIPRMNPDGAEAMFAPVRPARRTNASPVDGDNDGRLDEDGPEDLNKDGAITVMRVKDPKGAYLISPDNPRLMKKAEAAKGEAGSYAIYWEGRDADGDGFIAEDGPGGVDINRNFMHQYPYFQADAGRYMVSEPETRALLDFVLGHRNIAAILTFGESDNLVTPPNRRGELGVAAPIQLLDFADASTAGARTTGIFPDTSPFGGRGGRGFFPGAEGPGTGGRGQQPTGRAAMPARRPATTINAADIEYFRTISEKYRELTGIRSTGFLRAPAGAFFEYGYYQFGVPSFSTPGWGLPVPERAGALPGTQMGGAPGGLPSTPGGRGGRGAGQPADAAGEVLPEPIDTRLIRWMDAEKVDGFAAWAPFTHPTLGPVEIGGFKPLAATNPPASQIPTLGASHAQFVLYLTSLFPRVAVASANASALGGGLYRVTAEIENLGFLPTALGHAVSARAVAPTVVQLGVPPDAIVAGSEKTSSLQSLAGSGGRQAYEWLVRGKPGDTVSIKAAAQKGGTATATVRLK